MRICFISHTAGRGGAELALLELLQGLIAEGVECRVLVPKTGPLLPALDRMHIPWRVIRYPWMVSTRRRWWLSRIARTVKTLLWAIPLARIIANWRCDVVYSNTITVGAGALAAWITRRPHIWHLHEFGYLDHNLWFDLGERRAVHFMDRFSAIVIANSHAVVKDYARYIKPYRMRVIYQAVTLRDKMKQACDLIPDDQFFQCVIVGSLQAGKGQDEAISALSEVVCRGVNAHLLIVGDGGKRFTAALRQQVKDHGLEQRVRFHGYAENPMPLIRAADLMLMCSHWEAFGRVTVEAMLAGKALIGTASGGTTELIQDGETGLLYKRGNPTELADKIQYLYENPHERARLGAAAQRWAENRFTQKRYAKEVRDLLSEVLMTEKIRPPIPSN
ncbi:MAG: glycosyltransferase family 4 protein [Nitrosospira sp.]|nr:glycosyltransferase family 4 protein [Nitrosospira sp.]MDN5881999.1 glycosyltransferase family 4 protein [Nitrosospira sp.]